jgi:alpha-beta hydrolase superfamily lysophospholipase
MPKGQQMSLCKKIHFLSDGYLLRGTLHLPPNACPPVVIGSHGLLSDSDSPKQRQLAEQCNRIGLAYFRFDHRGCGKSQGYFGEVTSLDARANDLKDAIEMVRNR